MNESAPSVKRLTVHRNYFEHGGFLPCAMNLGTSFATPSSALGKITKKAFHAYLKAPISSSPTKVTDLVNATRLRAKPIASLSGGQASALTSSFTKPIKPHSFKAALRQACALAHSMVNGLS